MNEHRCRSTNHTDLELLRALVEGQTLKPHVRTAVQHTQTRLCSTPRLPFVGRGAAQTLANWVLHRPSQTGLDCAQHTSGSKALPRMQVERVFPLSAVPDAFKLSMAGKVQGKLAISVS